MESVEQKTKNNPFSEFRWFVGVIEDVADPQKIGRVRVRCFSYHSDNREEIPTDTLPWAPFLNSPAAMSAPVTVPGDWCVGFFMDGDKAQQPVVLGTMIGIPSEKSNPKEGFSDPTGVHPRRIDEGTNSHLSQENQSRQVKWKRETVAKDVPSADNSSWSEPQTQYAAKYPFNHVLETDSGNSIELDDTEGAERVSIFHRGGSFVEMHPNGDVVVRARGTQYSVSHVDNKIFVNGSVSISAVESINLNAGKDININAGENVMITAGKDTSVASFGNFLVGSAGSNKLSSNGRTTIDGSQIHLNSGNSDATKNKKAAAPKVADFKDHDPYEGIA